MFYIFSFRLSSQTNQLSFSFLNSNWQNKVRKCQILQEKYNNYKFSTKWGWNIFKQFGTHKCPRSTGRSRHVFIRLHIQCQLQSLTSTCGVTKESIQYHGKFIQRLFEMDPQINNKSVSGALKSLICFHYRSSIGTCNLVHRNALFLTKVRPM